MNTSAPGSSTEDVTKSLSRNDERTRVRTRGLIRADYLIDFAIRWEPYGGDEYIFPEFGISPATFYRRVLAILADDVGPHLDSTTREKLIALCRSKVGVQAFGREKR